MIDKSIKQKKNDDRVQKKEKEKKITQITSEKDWSVKSYNEILEKRLIPTVR